MRRASLLALPVALLVVAGEGAAHAQAAAPTAAARAAWKPGVASARAYAKRRAGIVSFAVRAPGTATGFRSTRRARSASVVKAMLLVAYLNRPDVRRRALNGGDSAMLGPMIRWSDNSAAGRVSAIVGLDGLERLARAAKMRAFTPSPVWGASQITAADQARFFERIDERIASRHRAYAMTLLRSVTTGQRWGVARARPGGWTLYFKGGWFPGANAVHHQAALLKRGRRRVSLAILISNSPSSAYANETLRGVALRLLRGIDDKRELKAPAEPSPRFRAPAARRSAWSTLLGAGWLAARGLLGLSGSPPAALVAPISVPRGEERVAVDPA